MTDYQARAIAWLSLAGVSGLRIAGEEGGWKVVSISTAILCLALAIIYMALWFFKSEW